MNLRRLNERGMEQFRHYLTSLREEPKTPPPSELIDDPRFSDNIEYNIQIGKPMFATKYDAAGYLIELLSPIASNQLRTDVGIWSWLAFWFIDQLCPPDGHSRRRPIDNVKYIARPGDHRFGLDKHLLFFPWKMRGLHGESARFLLSQPLDKDTREQREWTGYYHNVSTALVELCRRLYWDEANGSIKRGARSNRRRGNLRRFVQVARQLDVTYDIHGMSPDRLAALLPSREFSVWLDS